MTPAHPARRLLLVHAHPDDETIGTGATMASYAAAGDGVTLVTCTLGEEGEVVVEDLAHLAADKDDALGPYREGELAAACAALGVSDHRLLGGAGRWRDSGMMGLPTNDAPGCFWQADLTEATDALVAILREVAPQVVVTYDETGGYGHPDHIQAHRVTVAAVRAAADGDHRPDLGPAWHVAKLYYSAIPKSVLAQGIEVMRGSDPGGFLAVDSVDDLPFGVPDELISAEVTAADQVEAKLAAMRAHRSQISVDGVFFALADRVGLEVLVTEWFILAQGNSGADDGRETDLFAGLD